ncbi:MAG: glycosyltransferase [Candidatus Pacebacteria bacterium]|nr:glycosyltransferase [Candidatus Paceibacterota bacterium]
MSKRILIIITKGDIGGAQVFVRNLARGLTQKGFDITVGFGEGDFLTSELKLDGVRAVNFKYLKRTHNPLITVFFVFELRRFLKKEKYDVVQFNSTNSLAGALGVKLADKKIRTAFTVHGLSVLDEHYRAFPLVKSVYRLFFKFFLPFIDAPVFVSKENLETAQKIRLVKNGVVIYNGIDVSALGVMARQEARAAIGKMAGCDLGSRFVIGSIGRLSYQKNYGFLIESFRDILKVRPDAVMTLIGDGPQKQFLEAAIARLGLGEKIFLLGAHDNAGEYLKAFDLFVLPSRYEGIPITLEECLFAETPVLVSNVGGNGEITTARSLYALDDKAGFIEKFAEAAADPSLYVCDPGKKDLFSLDTMSKNYAELFEDLTA